MDERLSIYKHQGRDGTWAVYIKLGRYDTMKQADWMLSRLHKRIKPYIDALLQETKQ